MNRISRPLRVLAGTLLLWAVSFAGSGTPPACEVLRCTCMAGEELPQARARSDAVFLGRVLSVAAAPPDLETRSDGGVAERLVHFQVLGVWKGEPRPLLELRTGIGGGDCGFPFAPGETYLVFARGQGDGLSTSICSRTAPAEAAVADLLALGVSTPPHGR